MNTQITATPKLFIGIDIHKRSWKVHCATDLSSGKTFSMRPDAELLYEYVTKHYSGYVVSTAYEAGCCGYHTSMLFKLWMAVISGQSSRYFQKGQGAPYQDR